LTSFTDLGLDPAILKALAAGDYQTPTPIQLQAVPQVMAGRDLLGIAQTGTGKTAAFALPILHRLAANKMRAPRKGCRALVLSPTRELASQIAERFRFYGRHLGLTSTVVFGGVGGVPQIRAMSNGVDVLIATPGRLLDHMSQGHIRLDHVEVVVLDEADQMLDLGFIVPIRRIAAALSSRRQSLFFSATMPKEIAGLAATFLKDPVTVAVAPVATTAERVDQQVIFVEQSRKREILVELLADAAITRALVFTRTKHGADRVARHLEDAGIEAAAIHGNKSQSQRERALDGFKNGRTRVLVATDISARGIDVEAVSHVINYELPNVPESYVHRIGRTARAGAAGIAISLCDGEERAFLRDIEKLIRQAVPSTDRRANPGRDGERAPRPAQPSRGQRPQGRRPDGHGGHGHHAPGGQGARSHGQRHQAPREGARVDGRRAEGHRVEGQPLEGHLAEGHRHDGQRHVGQPRGQEQRSGGHRQAGRPAEHRAHEHRNGEQRQAKSGQRGHGHYGAGHERAAVAREAQSGSGDWPAYLTRSQSGRSSGR
jgi:ATP-dependent RNA helicase RhlE